jgi:predicted SprT family Zn-dependent metalloprotease
MIAIRLLAAIRSRSSAGRSWIDQSLSMEMTMPALAPSRTSRQIHVETLAHELFTTHGLQDWCFGFNRSKATLGLCRYEARCIELSVHLVERNGPEAVQDTLLHEIAHALVGPGHGHDDAWKRKCLEIGAKPERLSYEVDMPAGRWQARCGGCGLMHHKHRRPKRMKGWFCCHCGPVKGQLSWNMVGC